MKEIIDYHVQFIYYHTFIEVYTHILIFSLEIMCHNELLLISISTKISKP